VRYEVNAVMHIWWPDACRGLPHVAGVCSWACGCQHCTSAIFVLSARRQQSNARHRCNSNIAKCCSLRLKQRRRLTAQCPTTVAPPNTVVCSWGLRASIQQGKQNSHDSLAIVMLACSKRRWQPLASRLPHEKYCYG